MKKVTARFLLIIFPTLFWQLGLAINLKNAWEVMANWESLGLLREGRCKQISSSDPTMAGVDWNNFQGVHSDGSVILAKINKPGCIVRIWMTNQNGNATFGSATKIRIYLNGNNSPVVDLPAGDFFGKSDPFLPPLAMKDGHGSFSYVPISFSSSCLVTLDTTGTKGIFYAVQYQEYDNAMGLENFTLPLTTQQSGLRDQVVTLWNNKGTSPFLGGYAEEKATGNLTVAANSSGTVFDYSGSGIIAALKIRLTPDSDNDLMKNIKLRIFWDNESNPSIDVPLAFFFGTRFERRGYSSLPVGVTNGEYYCYFPMPFQQKAFIQVMNNSSQSVSVTYTIDFHKTAIDASWGRFSSHWNEEYPTTMGKDYNFLETIGRGHFVGVILNMDNTQCDQLCPSCGGFCPHWEGDERFYIDGEGNPPSINGTGSEDFFNQAWGLGGSDHAVHGSIVTYPFITNYRHFISDCIPFTTRIKAGIEVGFGNDTQSMYSSTTFYYLAKSDNGDAIPPLPPTNLRLNQATINQLEIAWDASLPASDGDLPAFYLVKRDNVQMGIVSSTQYLDTGLKDSTTYTYSILSIDDNNNYSLALTGQFTTLKDSIIPPPKYDVRILQPADYSTTYLQVANNFYLDQVYLITQIPTALEGKLWVRTALRDNQNTSANFLTFVTGQMTKIYVGYDQNAPMIPGWLGDFQNEQITIGTSHYSFNVYSKVFSGDTVSLPGNSGSVSTGMYIVLVEPMIDPTKNLALNKPVTVSSVEENLNWLTGSNAVDGKTDTRWASAFTDNEWIQVDLQSSYTLYQVVLRWETAYGQHYQLQLSENGTAWTTIYEQTSGRGGVEKITANGQGRFVRLWGIKRGTPYGWSLWEFEVYGSNSSIYIEDRQVIALGTTLQIYPHPLAGEAQIVFDVNQKSHGVLEIFNISGKRVARIDQQQFDVGHHIIHWQPQQDVVGLCVVRLKLGEKVLIKKIIVLK